MKLWKLSYMTLCNHVEGVVAADTLAKAKSAFSHRWEFNECVRCWSTPPSRSAAATNIRGEEIGETTKYSRAKVIMIADLSSRD